MLTIKHQKTMPLFTIAIEINNSYKNKLIIAIKIKENTLK
jgi:hypothetical protein